MFDWFGMVKAAGGWAPATSYRLQRRGRKTVVINDCSGMVISEHSCPVEARHLATDRVIRDAQISAVARVN